MSCNEFPTRRISWSEFIPYTSLYVKGVPDEIAAHMVRLATIEFTTRTGAIKRTVYIDSQADVADYCLVPEDDYTIKMVTGVRVNGRRLAPTRQWDECLPSCSYFYDHPNSLILGSTPSSDGINAIAVNLTLIPGQDTCFVDGSLYDEYAEDIAFGAISRLLLITDVSWYDPQSAGLYQDKFRRALARAKQVVARGNNGEPVFMRNNTRVFI